MVPTRAIQSRQFLLGSLLRIQQRRHHHDGLSPESKLCDANPRLSNRDVLRQGFVRLPVQRTNERRLEPANDVIILPQALPTSEVGYSIGCVQTTTQYDAPLLEQ